jgi:diguanylate cyclase (GGDEF)-like protein
MWRIPEEILASRDDDRALAFVLDQVEDPDSFVAKVRDLYAQPEAESYDTIHFSDGRVFERFSKPQRVSGVVVGRVWSFRDVTEHTQLESELARQAFHDSLTNLANQALFRDRVEHALARSARGTNRLAVMFIDLDNFKTVNDSLGHTAGDELLVGVTERLLSCIRTGDTAARLGGDEFAILLEDLDDRDQAIQTAERLIESLRQPVVVGGHDLHVSASVGIAFEMDGAGVDQVMRNADLAMYTAKRKGKARLELYAPEMHAVAVRRLELEGDLRRALGVPHELVVHYQPIVSMSGGGTWGAEALVRWQHPTRGLLSPDAFIPLAEETGLVVELSRIVLGEACREIQQLRSRHGHADLAVSVNLAPRQLLGGSIVDDVVATLDESGLEPSALILEITEGAMMEDPDVAIETLLALKRVGVRLAVDDFGTGYSSLSYLQRFPIDIIKIDRSFVEQLDGNPRDSLLPAIVGLSQSLGLTPVAEGVETASQIAGLLDLECDLAQGFHLARPMDARSLEVFLTTRGGRWSRRNGATPAPATIP